MMPAFLITFREVVEATLIVATILGILVKLKQTKEVKTVILAAIAAGFTSLLLLGIGSLLGFKVQELYESKEALIEGVLMIVSAVFITWAVFFLHKYFASYKTHLLSKIKKTVENEEKRGVFALVYTAVLREGFEIVLFLFTIYFSAKPVEILSGFTLGVFGALIISLALFSATIRLPVYYTFRISSFLLILFAGGLLARGTAEFAELGYLPEIKMITFYFIPEASTFLGNIIEAVFGITRQMNLLQLSFYSFYVFLMSWKVFGNKKLHRGKSEI